MLISYYYLNFIIARFKYPNRIFKIYYPNKNKKDANDYMAAIMIAKGGG